jgi:hypothetical protein
MKKSICYGALSALCIVFVLIFTACDSDVDPFDVSALRLTATTSRPQSHVYTQACTGNHYFEIRVSNINSSVPADFKVNYTVTDFFGTVVQEGTLDFNSQAGRTQNKRVPISLDTIGIFTVRANVDGGIQRFTMSGLGTRPRDFLNYAVFNDPSIRRENVFVPVTQAVLANAQINGPIQGVDKSMYFGLDIIPGGGGSVETVYDNAFIPTTWMGLDITRNGELAWTNFWNPSGGGSTDVAKLFNWGKLDFTYISEWTGRPVPAAGSLKELPYILQEITAYMPREARTSAGETGLYGGELSLKGEEEFIKYCEGLAIIHIVHGAHRPYHYYQILWEPDDFWGALTGWEPRGAAGDRSRTRVYELAYKTIHGVYKQRAEGNLTLPDNSKPVADARWLQRAVILGPTSSGAARAETALPWHENNFKAGMYKYIDGLSIHPYNDVVTNSYASAPEDQHANFIRDIMQMTRDYYNLRDTDSENPKIYDKPFFWGTEQGVREFTNGPLRQAQVLTRQNLMMLGEGFDANYNFCFADYNTDQKYGFFYNCTRMSTNLENHGPHAIMPKHAAVTLAAQTLLLKGYVGMGRITELTTKGNGSWGYKFRDTWCCDLASHACIDDPSRGPFFYAVWNFSGTDTVNLTLAESGTITVYNILGHDITDTVNISGSTLSNVTLTRNVLYVKVEP